MSLFVPVQATCPSCGATDQVQLAASVNADRRPDLRAAILAGTFQAHACPHCGTQMRLPAHLSYIDIGRRQWLLVEDPARIGAWQEAEQDAATLYAAQFGASAPPPAQALMDGGTARIVFGWAALREKIVATEAGLDDVSLELLKIAILRRVPAPPLADDTELRLVGVTPEELSLAWLERVGERFVTALAVPHAAYDEIAADEPGWAPLRAELKAGMFVDMNRMVLA